MTSMILLMMEVILDNNSYCKDKKRRLINLNYKGNLDGEIYSWEVVVVLLRLVVTLLNSLTW